MLLVRSNLIFRDIMYVVNAQHTTTVKIRCASMVHRLQNMVHRTLAQIKRCSRVINENIAVAKLKVLIDFIKF